MYQEIDDKTFVKEMRMWWQNSESLATGILQSSLYEYFDKGARADAIINKMMEKIDD